MAKEVEFFITEDPATVRQWAQERKEAGAILVGSSDSLLEHLIGMIQPDKPVLCRVSGAWLDECIQKSVRGLLSLKRDPKSFRRPDVTGVEVDLRTCFAFAEQNGELSIDARRQLLLRHIGIHAQDPRLTIFPAQPAR